MNSWFIEVNGRLVLLETRTLGNNMLVVNQCESCGKYTVPCMDCSYVKSVLSTTGDFLIER